MIHSNVGLKDALLEEKPAGVFTLHDPATRERVCPIDFHNRKAARNWANGRGLRVIEDAAAATPSFPRPLG